MLVSTLLLHGLDNLATPQHIHVLTNAVLGKQNLLRSSRKNAEHDEVFVKLHDAAKHAIISREVPPHNRVEFRQGNHGVTKPLSGSGPRAILSGSRVRAWEPSRPPKLCAPETQKLGRQKHPLGPAPFPVSTVGPR